MKIIVVSGGFDPIHSGHVSYLKSAKNLGDKLIVALNSDSWLANKKGAYFLPFNERKLIIENLSCVDLVIDFEDDEIGSASKALEKVKKMYPTDNIIFANGGDRNQDNIPEMMINGIEFVFSVGGDDKKNSSSEILNKWKHQNVDKLWGSFNNLYENKQVKVKELIVQPQNGTSFQKHFKRSEIWFLSKGECEVFYSEDDCNNKQTIHLKKFDYFLAPLGHWHQITNPYKEPCHIIEIQYGETCVEEDIERKEFYQSES